MDTQPPDQPPDQTTPGAPGTPAPGVAPQAPPLQGPPGWTPPPAWGPPGWTPPPQPVWGPGWGPPGPTVRREGFFVSLMKLAAKTATILVTIGIVFGLLSFGGALFFSVLLGGLAGDGAAAGTTVGDQTTTWVYGDDTSPHNLLSVPVTGVILGDANEGGGGILGGDLVTYGYEVKQTLYDAADEDDVDGVVLDMNTPGGTAYGANAIADGVEYYRDQTGKPVYAFVAGMSASGGMWAMSAADRIFADVGTATGSIGVIEGPYQYWDKVTEMDGGLLSGGVTTQNGIEQSYFTAGTGKDQGNPFRRLTPEEIRITQEGVNNMYAQFVHQVSETRKIPEETIRNVLGAHIYDEETALKLKLIDEVGNRQEAYEALAKKAGLRVDDWQVVQIETSAGFLGGLFGARSHKAAKQPAGRVACMLDRQVLAYAGDPSTLCAARR